VEVWSIIAVGQYIFPVIVLAKIRAPLKSWFYLILYPLFVYSWIPITFIGYIHRNDHEWSHTTHTRNMSYHEVLLTQPEDFSKETFLSKQAAK